MQMFFFFFSVYLIQHRRISFKWNSGWRSFSFTDRNENYWYNYIWNGRNTKIGEYNVVRLRINWLYLLQRVKTPPPKKKWCLGYDIKLHPMARLLFWRFVECGITCSLPLLPGPLWPGVVLLHTIKYKLFVLRIVTWY